jgi:hypothetical protein
MGEGGLVLMLGTWAVLLVGPDIPHAVDESAGVRHSHTTEVRHKVCACSVARKVALCSKQVKNVLIGYSKRAVPVHFLKFFRPSGSM